MSIHIQIIPARILEIEHSSTEWIEQNNPQNPYTQAAQTPESSNKSNLPIHNNIHRTHKTSQLKSHHQQPTFHSNILTSVLNMKTKFWDTYAYNVMNFCVLNASAITCKVIDKVQRPYQKYRLSTNWENKWTSKLKRYWISCSRTIPKLFSMIFPGLKWRL